MSTKIRAKKFFLTVQDDRFNDRVQSSIISILTDGSELYLNQYGKMFTEDELGSFDVEKNGSQGVLEFYPLDGRSSEYRYSYISYDTKQNIFDIGGYTFGNTVNIRTENTEVVAFASTSTIYSIPNNFSSAKLLVEISSIDDQHYEYSEINLVGVGSTSNFVNIGTITSSNDDNISQIGIGTYDVMNTISGKDLVFYSNVNSAVKCNVIGVSIANTSFTSTTARGLRYANIKSEVTQIASSGSPTASIISTYSSNFNMCYFIVQIVDNTNNEIQLSELVLLSNSTNSTLIEYGNVYSSESLGTFDSNISSETELLFTPNPNIDVTVTLLHHSVSYVEFSSFPLSINFKNAELTTGVSKLSFSSDISLKKDFNLNHRSLPIFERNFNGSVEYTKTNQVGVDLQNNLICVPDHFFTSGEKVEYFTDSFDFVEVLTTQTTAISGVGTDIVYVISTTGISVDDYFGEEHIKIASIGTTSVSLASTISSQINSGIAVTFYGLFESQGATNNNSAVGISSTYISGIGITDKLGGQLYVYKYDKKLIGLCTSPLDALSTPPKLIDLNSLGSGSNHLIISTDQNSKCLISVDNVLQSPIVSTGITAQLQNSLELLDSTLHFSGIGSFFGGDLIKIDDEIMKISSVGVGSTTFVEVQRPLLGTNLETHSQNSLITKLKGNYNIVRSKIYFSDPPYGPIYNDTILDINIRSNFQGRTFLRTGIPNSNEHTYEKNYIFDDISSQFDAITKDFNLTSNNQNIAGFSTSNSIILINNILQSPENDFNLSEDSSITEINFTGTATSALYDPNNANIPRGGIIVSVGSSNGFGYQPLVAAGGTAIVSVAGTISSISIGNSGSGYRSGIQTNVRVGVQTLSSGTPNIEYVGIASISNGNIVSVAITNPGFGYTITNPPIVVFDSPLSYSNLNLINSSGIGTQAKIDVVVGQGSSVIDFTITNYGYSYKEGDLLTIESGGLSGIPTDTSKPFEPFSIIVERIYDDSFTGWSMGQFDKLDDIDSLFTGVRRSFPLLDNGNRFAIIKKAGSEIDLKSVLVIFINDVLQKPDVAYTFSGGSLITFTEAPKIGDKCRILFYKGTPGIDVKDVDILETIKVGDLLKLVGDSYKLTENNRVVTDIVLPDTVKTNAYNSIGITSNLEFSRPVMWCKQKNDTIIDGIQVTKDRIRYEPNIFPISNLIQSVGIGSTQIFVDSIKTMFDPENENVSQSISGKIEIIDNHTVSSAIATAIVSIGGTIELINVVDGGVGYTTNPLVSIQSPIGIGTTGKAILQSFINSSAGVVTSIVATFSGYGYTYTNPPIVLIEPPNLTKEYVEDVSYLGDFGIITGINTSSVGLASTALVFDLYIPQDSYLRDVSITNPTITESKLQEGYYFKVSNSNVGNGVTSLRNDGSIIGIGTTGLDNIYQVISVSTGTTDVYGVGNDTVVKVTVSVSGYNGLSGIGYSSYYGDYSWGVINVSSIQNSFSVDSNYGVVGLNSTPIVRRYNQLRIQNYNDI